MGAGFLGGKEEASRDGWALWISCEAILLVFIGVAVFWEQVDQNLHL